MQYLCAECVGYQLKLSERIALEVQRSARIFSLATRVMHDIALDMRHDNQFARIYTNDAIYWQQVSAEEYARARRMLGIES